MNRGCILLASTSETDWIDLGRHLAAAEIAFMHADSSAAAVRTLDRNRADLLAVDTRLDDGVHLLLHARLRHPGLPLCVVGRSREAGDLFHVSFTGEDDAREMPVNARELAGRISRSIALRRAQGDGVSVQRSG